MTQHTPGPWAVHQCHDLDLAEKNGVHLGHQKSQTEDFAVFTDDGYTGNGYPLPIKQWEANARLIAAAPDLLEALEALTSKAKSLMGDHKAVIIDAEAAIAKARGS